MGDQAQPPRQRGGQRTAAKLVYFTPAELDQVEELARIAGRPVGRYIREAALGVRLAAKPGQVTDAALAELARIGNNLNQITRAAHAGGVPRVEHAAAETLAELLAAVRRL